MIFHPIDCMSKRFLYILLTVVIGCATTVTAQERKVQNKPYTDLRPFHFGVIVGTHLQDLEMVNVGPQVIVNEDGTTDNSIVTIDQDRWDGGFTVGVLGEFRLNEFFQLRIAPAMYFGTRHLTFRNFTPKQQTDEDGNPIRQLEEVQGLKNAYIACSGDIIFAGPRFNNHRPYLMAGVSPMLNLSGGKNDYIKLKRSDVFFEVGMGCDFYLPYFKLRPELKFMFGLTNCLDSKHADELRNKEMLRYTNAINEAHTKMIALSFYFE